MKRQIKGFAAVFVIGFIAGSASLVAIKGHDVEQLYAKIAQLKVENEQLKEINESLEKELAQKKRQSIRRIRKVEVHIQGEEGELDDFTKLAIYKFITQKTKPLIEQDLTRLDKKSGDDMKPDDLIRELINDQKVQVNNNSYRIKYQAATIGEILKLWVVVEKEAPAS
jgi:cell division protein FtsB